MSLSPYSGYHEFLWDPHPCADPAACCTSTSLAAPPTTTYWACAACSRNRTVATLASTLSHYDGMRAAQAARFRQPMASMVLPEHTLLIMVRFRAAGGTIRCVLLKQGLQ